MQDDVFFQGILNIFKIISDTLRGLNIPLGPGDWFFVIYTILFVGIIAALVRQRERGIPKDLADAVRKIVASAGGMSGGVIGDSKKLKFLQTPQHAVVFLRIEENAIQQALAAVDFYLSRGEIDEATKAQFVEAYQSRLNNVRARLSKSEDLKEVVETSSAVDKARSDYLRKMFGTVTTAEEARPPSIGLPGTTSTIPRSGIASTVPTGGPPTGGPPTGGPPTGGPPTGGPPMGGPPTGGPPTGGPPMGGPQTGGPPTGMSPGLRPATTGPATPPGGFGTAASSTPRSSLQSEMLAEMERLKALMSGD